MKKFTAIMSLAAALVASMIFGWVLANYFEAENLRLVTLCIGGALFVLSLIPMPKGVLPMSVNILTNYTGEVLDALLTNATTGNELVDGGHIRLEKTSSKFYIPRMKVGEMLQKVVEQPEDSDSKGDYNYDEKVLEPQEFMAFTTFNPKSFEKLWRPYQPKGPLVFMELPPEIQNKMLALLAQTVNFELGGHFINGEYGAGANQLFNGILTRIVADADVLKVDAPVAITEANVIATFKAVRAKIPKVLRKKKNLKLFCSVNTADMYDDALTALPNKGKNYTDTNEERYKGIPIVALADMPDDVIIAAVASVDMNTNFWGAVDFAEDYDTIQIDKLTNAGERFFFKMKLKADTNVAFGEEVVLYDARP